MSDHPDFNPHEADFSTLHEVAAGLYTYVTRFSFEGKAPVQNRSVVVHRPSQKELLIINPAELTPDLIASLRALETKLSAKVKSLISPGDWHYLFIGDYLKDFPGSEAFVCPGRIPGKNPGFSFKLIDVNGEPLRQLRPELETVTVKGLRDFASPDPSVPRYELIFFHPTSKALIAGDVLWYVKDELEPHHKALGIAKGVLSFHFAQWKMVLDLPALQESFKKVQGLDFQHFITIHGGPGNMLVDGAKSEMLKVLDWAKTPPRS